jgi:hypothetical protein
MEHKKKKNRREWRRRWHNARRYISNYSWGRWNEENWKHMVYQTFIQVGQDFKHTKCLSYAQPYWTREFAEYVARKDDWMHQENHGL